MVPNKSTHNNKVLNDYYNTIYYQQICRAYKIVDFEQSLKERSWWEKGLQTTQEEMKYVLSTQRKIPISRNRCTIDQIRYVIVQIPFL